MSYIRAAIAVGFAVELVLGVVMRGRIDANLINFGPAIAGLIVVAFGLILALVCLVAGITLLFRRRWNVSGFYLGCTAAFTVLTGWILYSNS